MRAVAITDDRSLELVQVNRPVAGAGEVVLDLAACGICGSDLHILRRPGEHVAAGHMLGPEFTGVIAALGPAVECWAAGGRVVVLPMGAYGECAACRSQRRLAVASVAGSPTGTGTLHRISPTPSHHSDEGFDERDMTLAAIEWLAVARHSIPRRAGPEAGARAQLQTSTSTPRMTRWSPLRVFREPGPRADPRPAQLLARR